MNRLLAILALLIAGSFCTPAWGACLTCSCTVTANSLSFGAFSPLDATPVDAVGSLDVTCTGLTTALDSLTITLSTGSSGAFTPRRLQSGANFLAYNLYSDAAHSTIWGDGTGGSSTLLVQNQFSLLNWTTSVPVYGRIPNASTTPPGLYSDTIVVTVVW